MSKRNIDQARSDDAGDVLRLLEQNQIEFTSACPSSAAVMRKAL
jgi:hypothetical protein